MYNKRCLGLEEARSIAEAIIKEASKGGPPVVAAVVGNAGDLIYLVRMDGTRTQAVHMAINKAYTVAITTRNTTSALAKDLKEKGWPINWFCDPRLTGIAGGACVRASDGSVVGGIGVRGRTAEEDEDLALAGVRALNL